jgi:Rrf2 family protein
MRAAELACAAPFAATDATRKHVERDIGPIYTTLEHRLCSMDGPVKPGHDDERDRIGALPMKLQKQTVIALLATLELARDPSRTLSAGEIAAQFGISVNHLAKVLRDLGRAGLVEAVRGVGGGYRFSGNAKRTSLYDVIHLFGDIAGVAGDIAGPTAATDIGQGLARVLSEIDDIAIATFKSISLATLLKSLERNKGRAALLHALATP